MNIIKYLFKKQKGAALPMALMLMVVGAFLIVPVLLLVGTNLKMDIAVEQQTQGVYAADAGINDFVWQLKYPGVSGNITDAVPDVDDEYTLYDEISGMTVTYKNVKEELVGSATYKTIESTARLDGEVKGNVVAEIYMLEANEFDFLLDSAIISDGPIDIGNNTQVDGDVQYGEGESPPDPHQIDIDGDIVELSETWPTCEDLKGYYSQFVRSPVPESIADLDITIPSEPQPYEFGPYLVNGDLNIGGNGKTIKIMGTIYVAGNFTVQPQVTFDLNSQTIFAEGYIDFQSGSTFIGSGCVVSCDYLNFQPSMSSPLDYKLLGVDDDFTNSESVEKDNLRLTKFTAEESGTMQIFRVYSSQVGYTPEHGVKVAIYEDLDGIPGGLLDMSDNTEGFDVFSGWNNITMGSDPIYIEKGKSYWLAANASPDSDRESDKYILGSNTSIPTAEYGFKSLTYISDLPTDVSDISKSTGTTYLFAGYEAHYVLLMSLDECDPEDPHICGINLQPGGDFIGTLAGEASVELENNAKLIWVDPESEGLNFPGAGGGGGSFNPSAVKIISYSIQPGED